MINNKKVCALVAVRAGSQRVKNKNLKNFNNTNLISLKLETLKNVTLIDDIILTSDSQDMIKVAKKHGVITHQRDAYYASSKANNSEFFENLSTISNADYILYSPVTSPFISTETISECLLKFENENLTNLVTANLIKHHMWLNNKPINYEITNSPNSQDLPDIHAINYGCCVISRNDLAKYKNIVTPKVKFYITNELESIDIDTELDFLIAELLHEKIKKN